MKKTRQQIQYLFRRFLVLLALCLLGGPVLIAQVDEVQDTSGTDKVHIDHADYWRGVVTDTGQYEFLSGQIELSQDSIFMYCDSAVIVDKQKVSAFGNVIIQKGDSLNIYADTLEYDSQTRIATLSGDVVLQHLEDQLWTTYLTYDLNTDLAYFDRSGILVNDSTQVSSKIGFYWVKSDLAKFIDSVVVIGEEMNLITDSLLYDMEARRADFIAPTWIVQDAARIYCEDGFYKVGEQVAEFRKNATYTNEDQRASADTIRYTQETRLVDLMGNAHFKENDRVVDSDRIQYFEDSGETFITGDATFQDSVRYVESEFIAYNRVTERLQTVGRSLLTEGTQILEADSLDFDQGTGVGEARGRVVFQDTAAQTIILCERADYNRETDFVKAYGNSRPLLKSLVDEDTMYVSADTFIFQKYVDTIATLVVPDSSQLDSLSAAGDSTGVLMRPDTPAALVVSDTMASPGGQMPGPVKSDTLQKFIGFPDVRIIQGTMQSLCDHLTFDSVDSTFHLRGSPVMWSDTSQFIADSIDITMKNKEIDKVYLNQKAFIVNAVKSDFFNQIKGRNMVAKFQDDEIHNLKVVGNAESIYYALDDEDAFVGVNRVASSEIFFTFENKGLDDIRFYTQPTGKMMPMEKVDHNALRLEGFSWKEDIRPKSLEDLF